MKKSTIALLLSTVAVVIATFGLFVQYQTGGASGAPFSGSTAGVTHTAGYYDAGLGFKLNGTSFLTATTFSLPSGVTASTINGVTRYYGHMTLNTATTTPCALQLPTTASTTLESTHFNVTVSTTTAGTVTLATSSTAFATTTTLFTTSIGSGLTRTFQFTATTTDATGLAQTIAPSTWIVYGVAGQTYGYTYGGTCDYTARSVN